MHHEIFSNICATSLTDSRAQETAPHGEALGWRLGVQFRLRVPHPPSRDAAPGCSRSWGSQGKFETRFAPRVTPAKQFPTGCLGLRGVAGPLLGNLHEGFARESRGKEPRGSQVTAWAGRCLEAQAVSAPPSLKSAHARTGRRRRRRTGHLRPLRPRNWQNHVERKPGWRSERQTRVREASARAKSTPSLCQARCCALASGSASATLGP